MRFLSLLSLLCLGALQPALAALNLTGVPACGLKCLATEVASSDCTLTNTTCICTNSVLLVNITECVTASCSIRDQLSTKKFQAETCGIPGEDRTALIKIIAIVFGALGVLAFVLRCMARLIGPHDWGRDDSVMCLVMVLEIAFMCLSVPISNAGLGLDMWFVPHDSVTEILKLYFFDEILYITALALTKVSILFFYLKVFPKRSFRICAWTLICLNLVYALTYDFLLIFQCNPISGAWTFWDGETESKCISINILGWSAAAINIALDLAVIALPLPSLFGLSLSMKKRLQIIAMFAVGFFITVVSVIRLYSLIHFGDTQNLTQDYVETGYWSTIEVPVGIICASMPAVRSLFSRALPKIFGTTRNVGSTFNTYGPSSANRLGPDSRNKISVKQEWSVLSEGPNDCKRSERDSSLELLTVGGMGGMDRKEMGVEVEVGVAVLDHKDHVPTRKMTLSKHDGTWRGMAIPDGEGGSYKSTAYTTERELR